MEKIKVKDLASEFQIENKEVREFLTNNGFDVKNANSNVDEEGVKLVRSHYADKKPSQPAAEIVQETVKEEVKVAEAVKEEAKTEDAKKEAPKKKKVIIVNNSQNSKNNDYQKNKPNNNNNGNRPANNNSNNNRQQNNGAKEPNPFRPMIPKPVVKPVVVERVEYQGNREKQNNKPAERRENGANQQTNNTNFQNRNENGRPQGEFNQERRQNDRPNNGNRPNGDRNNGQGYQKGILITEIMASVRIMRAAVSIMTVVATEIKGKEITLEKLNLPKISLKRQLKMWKNTEKKKNVSKIKTETNVVRKI